MNDRFAAAATHVRLVLLLLSAVALGAPVPALAATITVGSFAQNGSGCTLGNAILTAKNRNSVGGCVAAGPFGDDIVVLPAGSYPVTTQDSGNAYTVINFPITIVGNGSTITRTNGLSSPFFRFFTVQSGGNLTLLNLTLTGGMVTGSGALTGGGAIAVFNGASLTLAGVSLTNNAVLDPGGIARGGAITFGGLAMTIASSTISNNQVNASNGTGDGGLAQGGAIHVDTGTPVAISLTDVTVANNTANANGAQAGGFAQSGAFSFEADGVVRMTRCAFTGNLATANGASSFGGEADGGAIYFQAQSAGTVLELAEMTIIQNKVSATAGGSGSGFASGGGVHFESPGSGLSVRDSTFTLNLVNADSAVNGGSAEGGGLNVESAGPGPISIVRSAFVLNSMSGNVNHSVNNTPGRVQGAGLRYSGTGDLALSAVTFVSNSIVANQGSGVAQDAEGGGVYFHGPGTLSVVNATFANNSVRAEGGTGGAPSGGALAVGSAATVLNSIFSGNTAPAAPNCGGDSPTTSLGNNLFADGGACGSNGTDQVDVSAGLGPLTDTGKPGGVHLPLVAGSHAVDAGNSAGCPTIDQLGNGRAGACDVGAVELVGSIPLTPLVAAVLPASRAGLAGTTITAFVTIINAGALPAYQVGIGLATNASATLTYQTTDPNTNALTGTPNTPVIIPAGGAQSYVIALLITGAFDATDLVLTYAGTNTAPVSTITGLNTLLASGAVISVADVVALAASNGGIVDLAAPGLAGAFAVATVNLGAGGPITVVANTGGAALPVAVAICRTDAGGNCASPPETSPTVTIATNGTPTFGVFVAASSAIPLDPAANRIFVFFLDAGGITRGGTSVAVRTLP